MTRRLGGRSGLLLPVAVLLLSGGMVGCGGGSGGGNSVSQPTLETTRAASIRVVQQSRELPVLIEAVSGSSFANRSATSRQANDLTYSSELGLYYRVVNNVTNVRIDFFKDAEGTQSAGNATYTIVSFTTSRVAFNITDGEVPLSGTLTLTRGNNDTSTITGTVRDTRINESISPNLTIDASDNATGSIAVVGTLGTINYRNVSAQPAGTFTSNLEFRGATGDVAQNADSSGRVRLGSGNQTFQADYTASGAGILTRFENDTAGQQETIANFDTL